MATVSSTCARSLLVFASLGTLPLCVQLSVLLGARAFSLLRALAYFCVVSLRPGVCWLVGVVMTFGRNILFEVCVGWVPLFAFSCFVSEDRPSDP